MSLVVITGANRGIGLELARLYQQRGETVLATCRHLSPELKELGVETFSEFEVASEESIQALKKYLEGRKIGLLIHNAGIYSNETFENLDFDKMRLQFEVNALAPLKITKILHPLLAENSKVVLMTSRMGSIGDNGSGNYYGYRISKAALNMIGVNLAKDLGKEGKQVFIIHPGMVATEMTDRSGIPPSEAASMVIGRIDQLKKEDVGKLWHANGELLPW